MKLFIDRAKVRRKILLKKY